MNFDNIIGLKLRTLHVLCEMTAAYETDCDASGQFM